MQSISRALAASPKHGQRAKLCKVTNFVAEACSGRIHLYDTTGYGVRITPANFAKIPSARGAPSLEGTSYAWLRVHLWAPMALQGVVSRDRLGLISPSDLLIAGGFESHERLFYRKGCRVTGPQRE